VLVEHADARKGMLNLFAGFDTRTRQVYATTAERKRQMECIASWDHLAREIALSLSCSEVVAPENPNGPTAPTASP
jgi:hypothetical protein